MIPTGHYQQNPAAFSKKADHAVDPIPSLFSVSEACQGS